jgi:hypothetical protein
MKLLKFVDSPSTFFAWIINVIVFRWAAEGHARYC